jgi:hypothetical protein
MIIALLALALAMILGGLLAAFFGWDIVLVERGWTMVIAGSVTAASGALLLGIAAVISKLARIERRLTGLQAGFEGDEFGMSHRAPGALAGAGLAGGLAAAEAAGAYEDRTDENQPTLPLFEEQERREQDEPEDKPVVAEWPEDRDAAPVIPFPPRTTQIAPPAQDEQDQDLKVPDFLLADRQRNDEQDHLVAEPGLDLDALDQGDREPEAEDRDRGDEPLEPVSDDEVDMEPQRDSEPAVSEKADQETPSEAEAASDEQGPATVIGTYNSGDNKYVMFSDGSIEAQTPSGTFRFQSLDELKEFIAAGGEGSTSASL